MKARLVVISLFALALLVGLPGMSSAKPEKKETVSSSVEREAAKAYEGIVEQIKKAKASVARLNKAMETGLIKAKEAGQRYDAMIKGVRDLVGQIGPKSEVIKNLKKTQAYYKKESDAAEKECLSTNQKYKERWCKIHKKWQSNIKTLIDAMDKFQNVAGQMDAKAKDLQEQKKFVLSTIKAYSSDPEALKKELATTLADVGAVNDSLKKIVALLPEKYQKKVSTN